MQGGGQQQQQPRGHAHTKVTLICMATAACLPPTVLPAECGGWPWVGSVVGLEEGDAVTLPRKVYYPSQAWFTAHPVRRGGHHHHMQPANQTTLVCVC